MNYGYLVQSIITANYVAKLDRHGKVQLTTSEKSKAKKFTFEKATQVVKEHLDFGVVPK